MHLQQGIETFLRHCKFERNLSEHTLKAYRLDFSHFTKFVLAKWPPAGPPAIERAHLRDYIRSLHHYKPRTQRRRLAALKSLFGFLTRESSTEQNPTQNIRLDIRGGRSLPRTISFPILKGFFQHVYGKGKNPARGKSHLHAAIRDVALFELMFSSGMRVSEISNLRNDSIDLAKGSILTRGKGNKERIIPICGTEVKSALIAYKKLKEHGEDKDAYFFTNRSGRRLSEQSIRFRLANHARSAGLGKLTPHMFRHTVATMLCPCHPREVRIK